MNEKHEVKQFVLQNFLFTDDESVVTDGESLIARGIIDSTGILEVILFLEERFGIKVAEDEMLPDNFETIDAIAAFVSRRRGAAA